MNKKGFTLIELMVAMTIFIIIATLAIGAFVTVVRMKALTSNMKESQQKVRIAMELITRLAKQAEKVTISTDASGNKIIELTFSPGNATKQSATKFKIDRTAKKLYMYDCIPPFSATTNRCDWNNGSPQPVDLMGGTITVESGSDFVKDGTTNPPKLNVIIQGKITGMGSGSNPYYNNDLTIDTSVVLENIK